MVSRVEQGLIAKLERAEAEIERLRAEIERWRERVTELEDQLSRASKAHFA
jgi:chaperonin cofactor prefoldin